MWNTGDPPESGYYLATWICGSRVVVSELWFNPYAIYKWWTTRGYIRDDTKNPMECAITHGVVAWMPVPEPYQSGQ